MKFMTLVLSLCLVACSSQQAVDASKAQAYDIVVYGGTSGGVTAAVQARRMGKTVVLVEPSKWIGGLTTGGLGATDIGNKQAIGGISREFYGRIWQYYNDPGKWVHETRDEYITKRGKQNSKTETTQWTFEPHVADGVYAAMLKEAGVPVFTQQRLDLKSGVVKDGTRIVAIKMESGRVFSGEMFIDATYEGDLMAKAGVSYHVGREANAEFDETLNGIQTGHAISHQFIKNVDPYVTPGNPKSGLLPGIDPKGPGVEFAGDHRIQAYNYRMCTTDVESNRRAWPKPKNYDPARYEILLRNFEAGDMRVPWAPTWMPNRKTDTNNNFAFSTDFIGANWDYPDADWPTRDRIVLAHVDYQQGLMWTLANSPRVPPEVQKNIQRLGLAKDEFTDNDNWPRQLYVREARRMRAEYVMTEHNCRRRIVAEDSVGMGAYNMDSHNCQRYVTAEGFVRNEGDVQVGSRPYPISFRAIVPRKSQCTNLVVPVCLSATHIAYGSIRMEPVFMVLGQSAATIAAHAIDERTDVQAIDYPKLKARLLADKQVLDLDVGPAPEHGSIMPSKLPGVVVDDEQAKRIGFEGHGSGAPHVAAGYHHDQNEGKGQQSARFIPNLPAAGKYEVRLAYTVNSNRATNVPVTIHSADGDKTIVVDQKKKPPIDGLFISLGVYRFDVGSTGFVEISNKGTDGYVIADAVQFIPVK
jgi:hypothetical protein